MEIQTNGDDYISSFESRLWSFTYMVLMKFHCPIQFRVAGPDVPRHLDQHIQFFVPYGRDDVAEYIKQEWEHEVRIHDNHEVPNQDWWYSTYVNIYHYDGVNFYTEYADVKKMSENMMMYFTAKVKDKNADIKDFTDIEKGKMQ